MATVIRIADKEVFELLDAEYIEQQIPEDVTIFFACTQGDNRQEDVYENDQGTMSYVIVLPFEQVKDHPKEEIRELMLERAKERLQQAA